MSGYPDDREYDRDDDRDRRDRDRGNPDRAARAATAAPGTFLILNGLFGLVCVAGLSVPCPLRSPAEKSVASAPPRLCPVNTRCP